jgi:hypothetical protein
MRSKFLEEETRRFLEVSSQAVRIDSDLAADSDVLDRTTIAAQENGTSSDCAVESRALSQSPVMFCSNSSR